MKKPKRFNRKLSCQIDTLHKAIQAARSKARVTALTARLRMLEKSIP